MPINSQLGIFILNQALLLRSFTLRQVRAASTDKQLGSSLRNPPSGLTNSCYLIGWICWEISISFGKITFIHVISSAMTHDSCSSQSAMRICRSPNCESIWFRELGIVVSKWTSNREICLKLSKMSANKNMYASLKKNWEDTVTDVISNEGLSEYSSSADKKQWVCRTIFEFLWPY